MKNLIKSIRILLSLVFMFLVFPLPGHCEVDPVPVFCLAGWIPACSGNTTAYGGGVTYDLLSSKTICGGGITYDLLSDTTIQGGGITYDLLSDTTIQGGGVTYDLLSDTTIRAGEVTYSVVSSHTLHVSNGITYSFY